VSGRRGQIWIGTSGWSYSHWRERFYPDGLPMTKWLAFYAEQFFHGRGQQQLLSPAHAGRDGALVH
jgi:hypothetical protein